MNAEIYHTTSSPKLITKNNPFIFAQSIMYIKMILNVNIFISTTKHPRMRKKTLTETFYVTVTTHSKRAAVWPGEGPRPVVLFVPRGDPSYPSCLVIHVSTTLMMQLKGVCDIFAANTSDGLESKYQGHVYLPRALLTEWVNATTP